MMSNNFGLVPPNNTPRKQSEQWPARWLRERGLQADCCVIEATPFIPDGPFKLITHGLDGALLLEQSYRVHDPNNARSPRDDKDKVIKYEAAPRSGTVIYAPLPGSRATFRDSKTKYIAEGHGKAIALTGLGLPVIGITGIHNWHRKRDPSLLPDIAELLRPGDNVIVVPDGDFYANGIVADGAAGLLAELRKTGATSQLIDLSGQPLQKIDDLLLYRRGQGRDPLSEFMALPRIDRIEAPIAIQSLPADFAVTPPPAALAVVPGLLSCRSGVLFAPGRERKTTLTLYIAACVTLGRPVFGRAVALPGRVLYVTGEDEAEDVWRTLHNMIASGALPLTANEASELRDSLKIVDATTLPGAPRLTRKDNGVWQASDLLSVVSNAITSVGDVVLCILDTLSSLGLSETEGMNEAAAAYHREAARLTKEHRLCLLALHHTGKTFAQDRTVDMYGGRGASAIADNARFALQLQIDKGDGDYIAPPAITRQEREGKVNGTTVLRLHVHKMRWDDGGANTERPLWVRAIGWRYETFAPMDVVQSAVEITRAKERDRSEGRNADDEVLLNAMRGLERDGVVINNDQVMTLKVLPERRTRAALQRLIEASLIVVAKSNAAGMGRPSNVYQLPKLKYQ